MFGIVFEAPQRTLYEVPDAIVAWLRKGSETSLIHIINLERIQRNRKSSRERANATDTSGPLH